MMNRVRRIYVRDGNQVGLVHDRTIGHSEGIAEFSTLMNGPRSLGLPRVGEKQ